MTIYGSEIESREALHDALAQALELPAWYGRNLDALWDCLTDLHTDTELRVTGGEALHQHLGGYAKAFRRVLLEAAEENPRLHIHWSEEP